MNYSNSLAFDAKAVLRHIDRTEDGRLSSVILQGAPGIGKTALTKFLTAKGAPYVRIPLATRTHEDFGSYPIPDRVQTDEEVRYVVHHALSEASIEPLLERNIGKGYGTLVLDDVTLADPRVQSAILDIVQFGYIAGEKLGDNVLIFLTGNGTNHNSYAVEWSKALLGRCMLINSRANFDIWMNLDANQSIDPVVLAFLKDHNNFFAPEIDDEDTTDESGKTPSPRDWTRFGLALSNMGGFKNFQPSLIAETLGEYAECFTGSKAGAAFSQYASNFGVYPTGEELFSSAESWKQVPHDRKEMLSGAIAVIFALRNYAISLLEKSLDDADKCREIINVMFDRAMMVAEHNREVIAYMVRYFISWATEDDFVKERVNVINATAEVMTSERYQKDEDFKGFLDALWRIKTKG